MITVRNTSDGQISERIKLTFNLSSRQPLLGKLNYAIQEIKPELENLKVIPKTEQQKFKSEKYGYDEVIVEKVTADIDSNIKPENIKVGETILGVPGGYKGIDTSDADAVEKDIAEGKTAYVNGKKIIGDVTTVSGSKPFTPNTVVDFGGSIGFQNIFTKPYLFRNGSKILITENYDKIAEEIGLTPEQIVEGNTVLNIKGSGKTGIDTSDATASPNDILIGKTAYANNTKIEGTIEEYDGAYEGIASNINEWEEILKSSIDDSKGKNVTKLPNGLTSIGFYAFYNCTNLALTELPDSIETIDKYGFALCTNLALIKLSNSLTTIADNAFYNCTNLPLAEIPEKVTSIGTYAFSNCMNLQLTKLPDNLTVIKTACFQNCSKIKLLELPKGVTSIEGGAFASCSQLALTELPEGVTTIGGNSFENCTSLALTKLPHNLKTIGSNAFYNCEKITITEISEGITSIASESFRDCTSLTKINCKGNITTISNSSFRGCTQLTKFVLSNVTTVPSLPYTNAFTNTPISSGTGYIYVPDSLVESFKIAKNWSTYANQIKPISELEV